MTFAVKQGLTVMYVTEDTTRADPDSLRALYSTAIRAGASRICIADTVGHATPAGAAAVVRFVQSIVDECGGGVGIDWHGHRDRDLAIENSLAAMRAGATRLHGAAIGIGERVGNTPMDALLVNLVLMGVREADLTKLAEYCTASSEATGVPIPANYPVIGRDAYRTATGVHAAAVIKAYKKKDPVLADAVYSGVPASLVGREQGIEIGPMSGKSNVVYLAGETRPRSHRRARRPDLHQGEGGRGSADRGRNTTTAVNRSWMDRLSIHVKAPNRSIERSINKSIYLPVRFSIAGNAASSTSPTICRLRADTFVRSSQQAASLCHSG